MESRVDYLDIGTLLFKLDNVDIHEYEIEDVKIVQNIGESRTIIGIEYGIRNTIYEAEYKKISSSEIGNKYFLSKTQILQQIAAQL